MRGNPIVEIIAILVMLAAVLAGGGYWGTYKYNKPQEVLQVPEKKSNTNDSFESKHKVTVE